MKCAEINMAVSVWIQFQVVLVIAFSRIKIPDWCQFYGQWLGKFFLYGLHYRLNGCGILFICVKDTGSVLAAPVITLPVDTDRINNFKILLRQYAKRNNIRLIDNPDSLCKTGRAGTDLFIGGIWNVAVRITGNAVINTGNA